MRIRTVGIQPLPDSMDPPARDRRPRSLLHVALLIFGLALPVFAGDRSSSIERKIYFVEQVSNAVMLMGREQYEEALSILQPLHQSYADLDDDGQVAIRMGDCLVHLGREDEAWQAYESVLAMNPVAAEQARRKLMELELKGGVTDALVDHLRQLVTRNDTVERRDRLNLGRALQKRARGLLTEAADMFEEAVSNGAYTDWPPDEVVQQQTRMLRELSEDLSSLIEWHERWWSMSKVLKESGYGCGAFKQPLLAGPTVENRSSHWVMVTEDDRRLTVDAKAGKDLDDVTIEINGRAVSLDDTQKLLIQRHWDRINTILFEATNRSDHNDNQAGD